MRIKDNEKQERIKDAMISLILKEGINGASVAKIAKQAGVSPATIYVYYENKEEMLAEVFNEYARKPVSYLGGMLYPSMSGSELIECLIKGAYSYALENEKEFSFVDQCYSCPTLQESVKENDCYNEVFDVIHDFQKRRIIRSYSDPSIIAVLFAPVKFIAMNRNSYADPQAELDELIKMLQDMLLY